MRLSATSAETVAAQGFGYVPSLFERAEMDALAIAMDEVFSGGAGKRSLLSRSEVSATAQQAEKRLQARGLLAAEATPIQAIAFNKMPGANWKVAWHQDLQFPFISADIAPGCSGACRKDGIDYGQPPAEVLAGLLAVRVHLDDCDADNGPLRVLPETHRAGVLEDEAIEACKATLQPELCLAAVGDAILMRPLLLHASSAATVPRQRRVLHLVFAEKPLPAPARWH